MNPELKKLTEVQEMDCEIMRLRDEIRRYPQMKKTRLDEVRRAQTQLDAHREQIHLLDKRVRETEVQVRDWRESLKKFALQQSQIKDQKSYDALTHEMSEVESKIAEADEKGAELLMEQEELAEKTEDLEKSLEIKQRACDEEMRRIGERENEKKSLLARFELRRAQVATGVDAVVLKRYERLSELHPGSAIVPLEGVTCGGCHMNIIPRRMQALEQEDLINECDSCHRFLYKPSKAEGEA